MANSLFPEEQILKRMVVDNPWWTTGNIFNDFSDMKPRLFLTPFMELLTTLAPGRSMILLGPRRVGKTVMIFHAIRQLLHLGTDPRKILFLAIDTPLYSGLGLEELVDLAIKATKADVDQSDTEGYYIFFDEIQYLRNWESHLKVLCDRRRHIRFVASGSAAAALKMKSLESGAGRFTHFSLPPLLFCEYLNMVGASHLVMPTRVNWFGSVTDGFDCINLPELNVHFADYINYGGYPEVVTSRQLQGNAARYIKEDIVDKVLLRDLPGLYGISDTRDLYRLFIHIAYRSGEEFSYEDLSKESGIRKETLRRYIEYLESAFLIKVLHKIDENARRFQRVTTFKIYLTNASVFSAIFSPLTPADLAFTHMVETAVFDQFHLTESGSDTLFYANWKRGKKAGEVDMVRLNPLSQKPERVLEIKWSNRFANHPKQMQSLLTFLSATSLERAVVTTIDEIGSAELEQCTLQFVPAALYAYSVGFNSIK